MDLRRNILFTILLVTQMVEWPFLRNDVTKLSVVKCLRDGGSSNPSTPTSEAWPRGGGFG